jgi:ketosteroid isomerase-like protein
MTDAGTEATERKAVQAANRAYYEALSARDLSAMEMVWSRKDDDINIALPVRPSAHVGWEQVQANYRQYWCTLDQLQVTMDAPAVRIVGDVAWVFGIERVHRVGRAGEDFRGTNYGTSIFVKENGRWVLTFHQATPFFDR